jgi:hypothetical protein
MLFASSVPSSSLMRNAVEFLMWDILYLYMWDNTLLFPCYSASPQINARDSLSLYLTVFR